MALFSDGERKKRYAANEKVIASSSEHIIATSAEIQIFSYEDEDSIFEMSRENVCLSSTKQLSQRSCSFICCKSVAKH